MNLSTPHYLLFCELRGGGDSGHWRFALRAVDGSRRFEAADLEPDVRGERLALLTVVRALEALDQPSRVTLVNCDTHIRRGIQYGLPEWRSNGWRWEFFGQMVPVKNADLWQRMDRVLRYHRVECRYRRIDPPHGGPRTTWKAPAAEDKAERNDFGIRVVARYWLKCCRPLLSAGWRRRMLMAIKCWRRRAARSWIWRVPCHRVP